MTASTLREVRKNTAISSKYRQVVLVGGFAQQNFVETGCFMQEQQLFADITSIVNTKGKNLFFFGYLVLISRY